MSGVQQIEVKEDDDGQRLDRWLKKQLDGVPYALLQKMMRTGQVRVDGKRAKAETRLAAGQSVRVPPFEIKGGDKTGNHFHEESGDADFIKSLVIYDDGDVMALNKPYGLASQGGSGVTRHVDGLLQHLANKKGVRPRLVHRLDRDTSGILLVARSLKATQALGDIFASRHIRKYYWAILSPVPDVHQGRIEMPLAKGEGKFKDMTVVDEKEGKRAMTEFSVIDRAAKEAAFVAFWPRTGRTHQIRVHAASGLKCPILGDEKYGGDTTMFDAAGVSGRLHLHARRIVFPHPATGKSVDIMAPLPPELRKTWKALGFDPDDRSDPFADIGL